VRFVCVHSTSGVIAVGEVSEAHRQLMSLLRDTEKAKGKGKKLTPAEMIAAVRW